MSNLKDIRINPNNATAQFQGGVYSYEVINTLWDQGFVTGNVLCLDYHSDTYLIQIVFYSHRDL